MGRTVLFLDIDGVLHPRPIITRPGQGVLTALDLLEGVLRQVPHVEVVISSSWRERYPFDELRDFFAPDVRERIVDVTPLPGDVADAPPKLRAHPRQAECVAWLARHRPPGTPWLALDDAAEDFAPRCANLMLVDGSVGLTPAVASELLRRIGSAEERKHALADLIAQCDPSAAPPADLAYWDAAPPVGNEDIPEPTMAARKRSGS